eukprot:CAMPEP_0113252330 /NCGR_PEP_ID=MMETSP0008_2-20120614/12588_1 /TAXON_ID=97485 /ORGANISM="Prymnesium parvum" /LENGTH=117 /DNA_ID=CAMNT_0000100429 /DNA_START=698 /DNA_END=1051 /DNA_ORIENTATION=+ /assembly_acc=CAM_ASM_000153
MTRLLECLPRCVSLHQPLRPGQVNEADPPFSATQVFAGQVQRHDAMRARGILVEEVRTHLSVSRALRKYCDRVGYAFTVHLQQVLDEDACLRLPSQLQVGGLRVEQVVDRLVVQLEV